MLAYRNLRFVLTVGFTALSLLAAISPARAQNLEQSATYVSQVDEDLTLRRVAVLPVTDNVDGIYARPIEKQLNDLVKDSHRWDLVESNIVGSIPALIELEENPAEVQRVTRSLEADAFLSAAASRGPNGLSLRLSLFSKKDGKLISQEVLRDLPRFELAEIRSRINELYARVVAKIPYEGLILSRQQNRVTINLGKSDGLKKDQTVTAVQIISVNRHPKFNFIISSEKEILGRIKILKVDETLSFGAILSEKEKGAIQRFAKVSGTNQVSYPDPGQIEAATAAGDVTSRPDANMSFGKEPKEWVPMRPPSFGQVGMKLGFGSYRSSVNLKDAGTFEAQSAFYPSIEANGELWISPEWTVRALISQGVISTDNPRGSSSKIEHAMSRYSLELGYNFLLRDDFFGPKLSVSAGLGTHTMQLDDITPRAFTTTTYSGLIVGVGGSFPVSEEKDWYAGGRLNMYLVSSLQEKPASSGSSPKNSIVDFSLFVEKKIAENLRAVGSLDFSLYSTSFGGPGSRVDANGAPEEATSLSQRHSVLSGGINYLF